MFKLYNSHNIANKKDKLFDYQHRKLFTILFKTHDLGKFLFLERKLKLGNYNNLTKIQKIKEVLFLEETKIKYEDLIMRDKTSNIA